MFLTSVQGGQARMRLFFFTPHAKPETAKMQKEILGVSRLPEFQIKKRS
jgi:hypothetical protein